MGYLQKIFKLFGPNHTYFTFPRVYSEMMVTNPLDCLYEVPTCLVIATYKIEQLLPFKGVYQVNGNAGDVQLLKQQMDNNDFKALHRNANFFCV